MYYCKDEVELVKLLNSMTVKAMLIFFVHLLGYNIVAIPKETVTSIFIYRGSFSLHRFVIRFYNLILNYNKNINRLIL